MILFKRCLILVFAVLCETVSLCTEKNCGDYVIDSFLISQGLSNHNCDIIGFNLKATYSDLIGLDYNSILYTRKIIGNLEPLRSNCHVFITEDQDDRDLLDLDLMDKTMLKMGIPLKFFIIITNDIARINLPKTSHQKIVILEKNQENYHSSNNLKTFKIAGSSVKPEKWNIYMECPRYNNMNNEMKLINTWTKSFGFLKSFPEKCQSPLFGSTLRVDYIGGAPFIIYRDNQSPKGTDIRILDLLASIFNVKYVFNKAKTWGNYNPTTNISTGMVKALIDKTADFAVGHTARNYGRYLSTRFTTTIYDSNLDLSCAIPKPLPLYRNLITPFTPVVWMTLMLSTLTISITFLLINKVYSSNSVAKSSNLTQSSDQMMLFLSSLAALSADGNINIFNCGWSAGRVLVLVWKLMATLIIFSYSCNLRALLVKVEYSKPIDNLRDVVEKDIINYFPADSSPLNQLKSSPIKLHKIAYQQIVRDKAYFRLTKKGRLPFDIYDNIVKKDGCINFLWGFYLYFSKEIVQRYGYFPYRNAREPSLTLSNAFMAQKYNSPWIVDINRIFDQLHSSGLYEDMFRRDLPLEAFRTQSEKLKIIPLNMEHLATIFFVLVGGLFISSIIFIYEKYQRNPIY